MTAEEASFCHPGASRTQLRRVHRDVARMTPNRRWPQGQALARIALDEINPIQLRSPNTGRRALASQAATPSRGTVHHDLLGLSPPPAPTLQPAARARRQPARCSSLPKPG
jgi:hypothetical protein